MRTSATERHTGEYLPHLSADARALALLGRHKRYHSEIVLRCSCCGARGLDAGGRRP